MQSIAECCRNLEELSLHGWVAFTGSDAHWNRGLLAALRELPRLRRVQAPLDDVEPDHSSPDWGFETLLDCCSLLTQLNVPVPYQNNISALLTHDQASRLVQLRLYSASPAEVRLLRRCAALRRLALDWSRLSGVELSTALPGSLQVLTILHCEGPLAPLAPAKLAACFGQLELVSLSVPFADSHADSHHLASPRDAALLHALWTRPRMRVLHLSNVGHAFTDGMLHEVARSCPLLDTLFLEQADALSDAGFGLLLHEPTVLPRLRCAMFSNEGYSDGLDEFFALGAEELEQAYQEEEEESMGGENGMTEDTLRRMKAFFAFLRAVVARSLIVPLEANNRLLLPHQLHPLLRDGFRVGMCDVR